MKVRSRSMLMLAGALVLAGASPIVLAGSGAGATTAQAAAMCGTVHTPSKYKHVVVIMMENHSYGTIYRSSSAPYINKVMKSCGVATNYHNVTHLSLPNYLAVTSGLSVGQLGPYLGDCEPYSCSSRVGANNIFNEVGKVGGWMGFDESMPHNCASSSAGSYAPKHNPALYYADITAACSSRDVALGSSRSSSLLKHFSKESSAPAFSFVTPNLCSDMHDCSISTGDNWLKKWLPLLTGTAVYKHHNTVVFVVWDEGEPSSAGENCASHLSDQSCHVAAIVVAPSVRPGTSVGTSFSHYSLLKTSEDLLGVAELGGATSATSMASAFNL